MIFLIFFPPNNPNFLKKSQNNLFFRLFFKILHFKEETLDELTFALKLREDAPIGLTSASSVVNPIGACVLSYKKGANWSDTCVCFVIFF